MRVAVVGAGFAGLAAADALTAAGVEVVVFEARDRVGGRVWSRELRNGAVIEMGAEFVLPGNETLLRYVDRFGLGLWDKGMFYGDREPRGIAVSAEAMAEALRTIETALPNAGGFSAVALLDSLEIDAGAREAIQSRFEVSAAATADRVGADQLGGIAAHSHDVCPSIAGGNQQIALALAAELGSIVQLLSPVERIRWSESGVTVAAGGGELDVDRVVLALPASVVDRVVFEPVLPRELLDAYADVSYGNAAKLFVPLAQSTAPSAVLSVPERFWCWTATGASGVQPAVNAFVGSAPALERLRVTDGPAAWLESLERLRPDLALVPEEAVLSTWDDDPWIQAAYSSEAPPPLAWAPVGPFHVCGEHTHDTSRALMDGALASGLRVAQEVLYSR